MQEVKVVNRDEILDLLVRRHTIVGPSVDPEKIEDDRAVAKEFGERRSRLAAALAEARQAYERADKALWDTYDRLRAAGAVPSQGMMIVMDHPLLKELKEEHAEARRRLEVELGKRSDLDELERHFRYRLSAARVAPSTKRK